MFWERQKNALSMNHNHTEKLVNYLYPFTVSYGYDTISGLSVEPLDDHKDIARQITRTFFIESSSEMAALIRLQFYPSC